MDHLAGYQLDPPRNKAQRFAVILISRVDPEGIQVYKQESIENSDSLNAIACFRKLRTVCKRIKPTSTEKRSHALTGVIEGIPSDANKCRTLQEMPSAASIDEDI